MKPNGLVFAASITSHTSMSSLLHIIASSFTRPIFTARNVFSSSFTISATRVEVTGTTVDTTAAYKAAAASVLAGPTPPTTFGMLRVVNIAFPGSTRSGEKASRKSSSAFRPPASSIGCTTSSVVPGYVVDSRITSWPCASEFHRERQPDVPEPDHSDMRLPAVDFFNQCGDHLAILESHDRSSAEGVLRAEN